MLIGRHRLDPPLVLAPMAGISDRPFRSICRQLGAAYAVSEMTSSNPALWDTPKSRDRMVLSGETSPIGVQIAGADPGLMAAAAARAVDAGANIVDINMGCPAKKVCKAWAGSALLRDEALVERVLVAVVAAVDVPVSLKIRTGYDRQRVNGVRIAKIAEQAGISALAVHGRTRDMRFSGEVDYPLIAAIKCSVGIPVMANGDIDSPQKARRVLTETGADGLMIGRAARGRPWLFREIVHYLETGSLLPEPAPDEVSGIVLDHLERLHAFYGEYRGLRVARKHLAWYAKGRPGGEAFRTAVNRTATAAEQRGLTEHYFSEPEADWRAVA